MDLSLNLSKSPLTISSLSRDVLPPVSNLGRGHQQHPGAPGRPGHHPELFPCLWIQGIRSYQFYLIITHIHFLLYILPSWLILSPCFHSYLLQLTPPVCFLSNLSEMQKWAHDLFLDIIQLLLLIQLKWFNLCWLEDGNQTLWHSMYVPSWLTFTGLCNFISGHLILYASDRTTHQVFMPPSLCSCGTLCPDAPLSPPLW